MRLFGESEMYIVSYGNRRIPLKFDMHLKSFEVGRYQGTMRASSYESVVKVSDRDGDIKISMNEPLDHHGYTFIKRRFRKTKWGGRWLRFFR